MNATRALLGTLVAVGVVAVAVAVWLVRPPTDAASSGTRAVRPAPAAGAGLAGTDRFQVPPEKMRALLGREGVPVPAGAAAAAGPLPEGAVRGLVIDHRDEPVPGVTVYLYRGPTKHEQSTDGDGRFAFEALPRGRYRLFVEPRSLPAGLLAPFRQQVARVYEGAPSGFFGTVVELREEAPTAVDLRVLGAASARGRVVDRAGEPIANALVHFVSVEGVEAAARSRADGGFEAQRLHPGRYTASVELRLEGAPVGGGCALPLRFDLAAGEDRQLPDLALGVGGHLLTGTVVDERDEPLEGLAVECREADGSKWRSLWRARTDAAGRYELGRVRAAEVVVAFGPDEAQKSVEHALLARPTAPLKADLRGAAEVLDLGLTRVERNRPFRVAVRVEVDPVWAAGRDLDAGVVSVHARGETDGLGTHIRSHPVNGTPGELTWACRTPSEPVTLQVVLGAPPRAVETRELVVRPRAGGTEEVVVRFP